MENKLGKKPRLLLVDDHPVVREGIRSYLSAKSVAEVVGEAENGAEALRKARLVRPDVVLMDINLPDMSGFVVTDALLNEFPTMRVLIMTMHKNREYVAQVLRSGACGYLVKDAKPAEMVAAIAAVFAGENYFSPEVRQFVTDATLAMIGKKPAKGWLSVRERMVVGLVADGKSSKDIAETLGLSVRTIEKHRERIMAKTGIRSVAGLTRLALAEGLINATPDRRILRP